MSVSACMCACICVCVYRQLLIEDRGTECDAESLGTFYHSLLYVQTGFLAETEAHCSARFTGQEAVWVWLSSARNAHVYL